MNDRSKRRRPRNWPSVVGNDADRASIALTRLEDITRLISEWVWEADTDGRITFVSERIFESLNLVPRAAVGRLFTDFGSFRDAEGLPTTVNWDAPFRDVEFEAQDMQGRPRQFLVSSIPFFNRETWAFDGVCGTARDITDLQQAEIAKREFIAVVSHELRTPLTSIRGSLDLINQGVAGELPEKARHMMEIATRNSHRLIALIDDILDIERIEIGHVSFTEEPVDVSELAVGAIEDIQHLADEHGVSLSLSEQEGDTVVKADPMRLTQVLTNLLSNAVKFSPTDKPVTIGVKRMAETVRFYVKDQGPGIPKDSQDRIFDRFTQVDSSTTRRTSGTGLGLAISKAIVQRLGGSIWLESEEEIGSTFYVDLPPFSLTPKD